MILKNNCQPIVRSWAGQNTGETVYETKDGNRWVTGRPWFHADMTTGLRFGYLRDGKVCDHK